MFSQPYEKMDIIQGKMELWIPCEILKSKLFKPSQLILLELARSLLQLHAYVYVALVEVDHRFIAGTYWHPTCSFTLLP